MGKVAIDSQSKTVRHRHTHSLPQSLPYTCVIMYVCMYVFWPAGLGGGGAAPMILMGALQVPVPPRRDASAAARESRPGGLWESRFESYIYIEKKITYIYIYCFGFMYI